jgi:hypothetical protein
MTDDEAVELARKNAARYGALLGRCIFMDDTLGEPPEKIWLICFDIIDGPPDWCWLLSVGSGEPDQPSAIHWRPESK